MCLRRPALLEECPLGRDYLPGVRLGNLCASRSCLLILLACARGAFWACEQPGSSIMLSHPRWKMMLGLGLRRLIPRIMVTRCWMAGYGHFSAKPTLLWGDASASQLLLSSIWCCGLAVRSNEPTTKICLSQLPLRPYLLGLQNRLDASLREKVQQSGAHVTRKYVDSLGRRRCAGGPAAPEPLPQTRTSGVKHV